MTDPATAAREVLRSHLGRLGISRARQERAIAAMLAFRAAAIEEAAQVAERHAVAAAAFVFTVASQSREIERARSHEAGAIATAIRALGSGGGEHG